MTTTEETQTRSFRLPSEVLAQVEHLADADDRSANWMLVHLLRRALAQPLLPPTVEQIREWADRCWAEHEGSGGLGKTYEVTATFRMPHFTDGDQKCYALRDALVRFVHDAGARDVVTRLIALGPMVAETQPEMDKAS